MLLLLIFFFIILIIILSYWLQINHRVLVLK